MGDGRFVSGGLAADSIGTLYGMTSNGGNFDNMHCGDGCGTIYSVDPASGKFATVHKFTEAEGLTLNGPLISGGGKIFYGTAGFGGPGVANGGGTIFKFDAGSGAVSVLYTLKGDNGAITTPTTGLALAKGGLYGSAFLGGPSNFGGIYRLDLATKSLKLIYPGNSSNVGRNVSFNMVVGKDGMVYGATRVGAPKGSGALFRINPNTQKISALHSIDDGSSGIVTGPLTVGPDGALYGITGQGNTTKHNCGGIGCGTVFRFDLKTLKLTTLHSFTGGNDGGYPIGEIAISSDGKSLYGVTGYGGFRKAGTLYRIDLATNKLTVLHAFAGGADGAVNESGFPGVTFSGGRVFGTATAGGIAQACNNEGCGTVFEQIP